LCNTGRGSYGQEQLAWIDGQLAEGKPTFVMSHYMRLVTQAEESTSGITGLPELIDRYDNVQAFLAGHTHRWLDQTIFNNQKPHWVVAATRYDADNFWIIEVDAQNNTFTILDRDKIKPTSTCAETYSYDGDIKPVPNAEETGDCVIGL
jgi:hypothetical protein